VCGAGDERCNVDAALAKDGTTALHAAARAGHANVVRLLLDGGADVLAVDSELSTALHAVGSHGHGLCVKALLDAGADPEAKDGAGHTPLSLAEAGGHLGTARMMRLHVERRQAQTSDVRARRT
jgi:ankyrin repeat protein